MSIQDFINVYLIQPLNIGKGYNIFNTTAMAFLIVLFAYGMFEALKRLKIKVDEKFVISFIPFTLFAIFIRVFEDAGIVNGILFISPGIWILFFGIIFSTFLISVFVEKKMKIPYYKIMTVVGLILLLPALFIVQIRNISGMLLSLLFFIPILVILKIIKWDIWNKVVTAVHGFDAIATFVSIEFFNYREIHVFPSFFINLTGTAFSFIILKLVVVVSVLLLLDKYTEDNEFKNFMKFAIGVIGFVPGVRDFIRLIWFV